MNLYGDLPKILQGICLVFFGVFNLWQGLYMRTKKADLFLTRTALISSVFSIQHLVAYRNTY